jgi:putative membrane protein
MRLRNVLLIAVPATALMTVPAVAQTYGDHPHMGAWGWGGMIFGPIMMIVFIALIVGAVVLVIRWTGLGGSAVAGGANKARHILDERFARGEIDKDDYEERKRVLSD